MEHSTIEHVKYNTDDIGKKCNFNLLKAMTKFMYDYFSLPIF